MKIDQAEVVNDSGRKLQKGPFIRGKITPVLCKTRLIFPRINGPNE